MNFYAIQVKSLFEDRFIRRFRAEHPECTFPLHFPRRRLNIRKQGITHPVEAAIFPGYLFIEADECDLALHRRSLRSAAGFYRFLKSNENICPLQGRDLEIVLHFIKRSGPVAGVSKVRFDENSRIVVLDGPLSGLEGNIIKIDKRKGRAKVRLDLYGDTFTIDLAFEVMNPLETQGAGKR